MDTALGNIDILFRSETKIDDTFPNSQFMVGGSSKPIRLDRNDKGEVLCCLCEDVHMGNIEGIFY